MRNFSHLPPYNSIEATRQRSFERMKKTFRDLAKRERQILETVYSLGRASASDVLDQIPDSPTYSTVRKILSILEEKGYLRHTEMNRRFVYIPTRSRNEVGRSSLKHLMETLFDNSAESVVSALLDISDPKMSDDDFRSLAQMIEQKRKERE
jgi:predicted transcriptional regulator